MPLALARACSATCDHTFLRRKEICFSKTRPPEFSKVSNAASAPDAAEGSDSKRGSEDDASTIVERWLALRRREWTEAIEEGEGKDGAKGAASKGEVEVDGVAR